MKRSALVIFKDSLSRADRRRLIQRQYDAVIAPAKLSGELTVLAIEFVPLESLTEAGSIYEASTLVEELSRLTLPDGTRVTKAHRYKGYELWWIHYNSLFLALCLPYTQSKKLLEYLRDFETVTLFEPPHEGLYTSYLRAYGRDGRVMHRSGIRAPSFLPFGVFVQIVLTLLSVPILAVQRRRLMVFTGDKFAGGKDYDARMKFVYEELRERKLAFVEFVRSLESWRTVLSHAVTRKRPVVYAVAVQYLGRFMSTITFAGYRRKGTGIDERTLQSIENPEQRFKLLLSTQYEGEVDSDIWAIRITQGILWLIGVKVAFFTMATDRNLHTVLGCKMNAIPTAGVLHGVASKHYNVYDFLPTYDGEKSLSLDRYGLWSEWWKEYYLENGKAYREEQLYVSGPMRPLIRENDTPLNTHEEHEGPIRVLFVSEQLAVPEEVLPYLTALMRAEGISVYIVFRPYRDGFQLWLEQHHPEILAELGETRIFRNGIKEGIPKCDVVVGSHSTAVLEALFALKPLVFFETNKWGDYFDLERYSSPFTFYAKSPEVLIDCVRRGKEIPAETLQDLLRRFFGDPYQNGSRWVVDQLASMLPGR